MVIIRTVLFTSWTSADPCKLHNIEKKMTNVF